VKTWFKIEAKSGGIAEIYVYDELGAYGIRADRFIEALKSKGNVDEIALHINSPGGDPFAAAALYLALKRHPATVTAYNDGLVASAASVVLMAGDKIIQPENALLMIHDPIGGVFGTADEMRDFADAMDKIKMTILTAYRRSGKTDEELAKIMSAETWYTAAEALAAGFVDEISKEIAVAAFFDLKKFANPPAALSKRTATPPGPTPTPQPAAVDPEQLRARVRIEETERVMEIFDLCSAAGVANIASVLVGKGLSVAEVRAQLADAEFVKAQKSAGVSQEVKEIVAACTIAGLPDMAQDLIAKGMTVDQVRDRLKDAPAIRDCCAAAFGRDPKAAKERADKYIRAGLHVSEVRNELLHVMQALDGPEIDNRLSLESAGHGSRNGKPLADKNWTDQREIYNQWNRRAKQKVFTLDDLASALKNLPGAGR
jgi:ATP-dependent protease ClpP protease subunit